MKDLLKDLVSHLVVLKASQVAFTAIPSKYPHGYRCTSAKPDKDLYVVCKPSTPPFFAIPPLGGVGHQARCDMS
jgi:hypothetical protein